MQKRHITLIDPGSGQARPGAFVTIKDSTTHTLATLFADNETTTLPNPLTADATGTISFKAPDGEYDFVVSGTGFLPRTIDHVQIADNDSFAKSGGVLVAHTHDSAAQGGQLDAEHIFVPNSGTIPVQHIMSAAGTSRFDRSTATVCILRQGVIPLKVGNWGMRPITAPVSLTNTGLPVNTIMYVYAFDNGGVTTLEASTTSHVTDAEYGVEIKSGNPTRTLVGAVVTNAAAQFVDQSQFRWTSSYFSRRNRLCQTAAVAGTTITTTSGSPVILSGAWNTHFFTWGDEAVFFDLRMLVSNNTLNAATNTSIGLGNVFTATFASVSEVAAFQIYLANAVQHASVSQGIELQEGAWYVSPVGRVSAGTGSWQDTSNPITGIIRG